MGDLDPVHTVQRIIDRYLGQEYQLAQAWKQKYGEQCLSWDNEWYGRFQLLLNSQTADDGSNISSCESISNIGHDKDGTNSSNRNWNMRGFLSFANKQKQMSCRALARSGHNPEEHIQMQASAFKFPLPGLWLAAKRGAAMQTDA